MVNVYEKGFVLSRAVLLISYYYEGNNTICNVIDPDIADIFENIEIYKEYSIEKDDVKFYTDDEIKEQLLNSDFLVDIIESFEKTKEEADRSSYLSSKSNYSDIWAADNKINRNEIKIKIDVSFDKGVTKVELELLFLNLFKIDKPVKDTYLNLMVKMNVDISTIMTANVDLSENKFDVGTKIVSDFGFEIKLELSNTPPSPTIPDKEQYLRRPSNSSLSAADIENLIKNSSGITELNLSLVRTHLPISVDFPGIDLIYEPIFVFKIDISASIESNFRIITKTEGEIANGNISSFNTETKFILNDLSLSGAIEFKTGLKLQIGLSIVGLNEIDISAEIGGYAKLGGSFVFDFKEYGIIDRPAYSIEIGVYLDVDCVFSIEFGSYKLSTNYSALELKYPLIKVGDSKVISIITPRTLTVKPDKNIDIPTITLRYFDMFTKEVTFDEISADDFGKSFALVNASKITIQGNKLFVNLATLEGYNEEISIKLLTDKDQTPTVNKALFKFQFGSIKVNGILLVAKTPIPIDRVVLEYTQVEDDVLYEDLYSLNENTPYFVRDEKDDIKDFQIGRLIKVTPIVYPMNASYKTFDFDIYLGGEYVELIKDQPKTVNENGLDTYYFRVKLSDDCIGKEIKVKATSNGYTGDYSVWNKQGDSDTLIIISSIPAEIIDVTTTLVPKGSSLSVDLGIEQNVTRVTQGSEISFELESSNIFPSNATRGSLGQESMTIESGSATLTSPYSLKVNEDAEIGSQIKILYKLGNASKYYYLQVVKNSIENIILSSNSNTIKGSETVILNAELSSSDGSVPTLNDVRFIVLKGKDICEIEKLTSISINLTLKNTALYGDFIEIVGLIEGRVSETIRIDVDKYNVESLVINSPSLSINKGDVIQITSIINPVNSDIKKVEYKIVEDEHSIAEIDKISGRLYINGNASYGNVVKVSATCDGVNSNELDFVVSFVPVRYLLFAYDHLVLTSGDVIKLSDFTAINQDATNKEVFYSIESTKDVHITDDYLIVGDGVINGYAILTLNTSEINGDFEYVVDIEFSNSTNIYDLPEDFYLFSETRIENVVPSESFDLSLEFLVPRNHPWSSNDKIINVAVKITSTGPCDIIDKSNYEVYNDIFWFFRGKAVITVRVKSTALPGEVITIFATYKETVRKYIVFVKNGINDILVDQNKKVFSIGDTYQFTYFGIPNNISGNPAVFTLLNESGIDQNYVNLSSNGYAEFLNPGVSFSERDIIINVVLGGIPKSFTIKIINSINHIELLINHSSNGVRNSSGVDYIESGDFYLVNPDANVYLNYKVSGVGMPYRALEYNFILDEIGSQYFEIDLNNHNNLLTVKKGIELKGGVFASLFIEGDGILSDPIILYIPLIIKTKDDFKNIEKDVFGYYTLQANIDLNYEVFSIPEFYGVINGSGYIISKVGINVESYSGSYGLVGKNYGVIMNLTINYVNIKVEANRFDLDKYIYVGVIAGTNFGYISNCRIYGDGSSKIVGNATNLYLGGIVGANYGKLIKCNNSVDITSKGIATGGIAALNGKIGTDVIGLIDTCINHGDIIILDT